MKKFIVEYRVDNIIKETSPIGSETDNEVIEAESKDEAKALFLQYIIDESSHKVDYDEGEDEVVLTIRYEDKHGQYEEKQRYVVISVSEEEPKHKKKYELRYYKSEFKEKPAPKNFVDELIADYESDPEVLGEYENFDEALRAYHDNKGKYGREVTCSPYEYQRKVYYVSALMIVEMQWDEYSEDYEDFDYFHGRNFDKEIESEIGDCLRDYKEYTKYASECAEEYREDTKRDIMNTIKRIEELVLDEIGCTADQAKAITQIKIEEYMS